MTARNKFNLSPVVCIHPKPLSFIFGNTDIGILSSYLPTSPPIAPVLDVGLVSAGSEMTVVCEMSLNLFVISLILTFSQLTRLKLLWKELLIPRKTLLLS